MNSKTVKINLYFLSGHFLVLDHSMLGTALLSMETESFPFLFLLCVFKYVCAHDSMCGAHLYVNMQKCICAFACGNPRLMLGIIL